MLDIGALIHDVVLQNPSAAVADSDGGFTQTWTDLVPRWWAEIKAATARDLERVAAGTVLATATHLATMRFLPGVTTQTRIRWTDMAGGAHVANVTGVQADPHCTELVLACVEVVQ